MRGRAFHHGDCITAVAARRAGAIAGGARPAIIARMVSSGGPIALLVLLAMTGGGDPPAGTRAPGSLAGMAGAVYAADLQGVVTEALRATIAKHPGLDSTQIAVTLVDLSRPRVRWAAVRGDSAVYPASVVKLFYLVAAHRWLADGRIADTPELRRALHDMIVDSSNDATSYVVDVLTGTTSGPELPDSELVAWQERRNAMNRYFATLGFAGINANKKPWGDGPYGRETQASAAFPPGRNLLTTNATARLLAEIATGRAVAPERCTQMLELLRRDPFTPRSDPDDQNTGFSGSALTPGMQFWSKAGWTSQVRHDAALIQRPDGRRLILVTFTQGHADDRTIVPDVAREVLARTAAH